MNKTAYDIMSELQKLISESSPHDSGLRHEMVQLYHRLLDHVNKHNIPYNNYYTNSGQIPPNVPPYIP